MLKSLVKILSLCALVCLPAWAAEPTASDQIKRGEYLAVAGDCGACHTDGSKAQFSGGHAIVSPLGTIYSTNITPSKTAGIGNYSLQQFSDALRKGVRGDGSQLYPAMPYTAYAKLTDEDVAALYAYFMHGVLPVDDKPTPTDLPFPFNLRFSMAVWNWLYLDDKVYTPEVGKSAEWNRGAYLVQGLTHCSTCHTPRNFLMAEEQGKMLQGASLGTWYAPDVTAAHLTQTHWDRQMLTEYLATGHADNGATAAGPMLEAIDKSFSRMTPEDLQAIATYLLPDDKTPVAAKLPGITPVTGDDTPDGIAALGTGGKLYLSNCAACHNQGGEGLHGLPALKGHPVLQKPTADNVAMAILDGVWPANGQGMIAFASQLNDSQVADITNYMMTNFSDNKVSISADRVSELRKGGSTSLLLLLTRCGMIASGIMLILFCLFRRKHHR